MTEYLILSVLIYAAYYVRWFLFGKEYASIRRQRELEMLSRLVKFLSVFLFFALMFLFPVGSIAKTSQKASEIIRVKKTLLV